MSELSHTVFLPSNFISPGITSRLMEYEKNLQITKPKNDTLILPKHVSFKNDSYQNSIF